MAYAFNRAYAFPLESLSTESVRRALLSTHHAPIDNLLADTAPFKDFKHFNLTGDFKPMNTPSSWTVTAVGTERGRPVLFLSRSADQGAQMIVPTDTITMARLAADGVKIRNINHKD